MSLRLVGTRSSQPLLPICISREVNTFISYQGQAPSSRAVRAPDLLPLEPLMLSAIFGRQP